MSCRPCPLHPGGRPPTSVLHTLGAARTPAGRPAAWPGHKGGVKQAHLFREAAAGARRDVGAARLPIIRSAAAPLRICGLDLHAYDFDPAIPDEAFTPAGELRAHWRPLAIALRDRDAAAVTPALVTAEPGEPPDSIPLLLPESEWRFLETGLRQRVKALNLLLADLYGDAAIVRDGVVPAAVVGGSRQFRVEMRGAVRPEDVPAAVCRIDVARAPGGFRVLRDNVRCPGGGAPMVAVGRVLEEPLRRARDACAARDTPPYASALLETLRELAPGDADPRVALLTPGHYNAAFAEHALLAKAAGMELVTGPDLFVEDGQVHLRGARGSLRVHVLYRQVDDDFLDPLAFRPDSVLGVPGLLHACRLGSVAVLNAPGTGVADDPAVFPFVAQAIRYYLAEEPLLPGVETWACVRPDELEYALDHLGELTIEQRGNNEVLFGPGLSAAERAACAARLRAAPDEFVARRAPPVTSAPCLVDGRLGQGAVALHCFVLQGRSTRVVPGALCRDVPTSPGGPGEPRAKDVWIVPE
ncbi:MAG: circularly permuted type 2 ATP-grasp protein [Gammaproteobacteria bacterium]|nr:circularly permuted type 2 ATP-grasp protein [Gammaproteobacteria bacterium]